jgi:hypothetical protein
VTPVLTPVGTDTTPKKEMIAVAITATRKKALARADRPNKGFRPFRTPDFIDPEGRVAVYIGEDCGIEVPTGWLGRMSMLLDMAGWYGRTGRFPEEMGITVTPHERVDGEPYVHPMFDIKDIGHRHTTDAERKQTTTLWRLFVDTIGIDEPLDVPAPRPQIAVALNPDAMAKQKESLLTAGFTEREAAAIVGEEVNA